MNEENTPVPGLGPPDLPGLEPPDLEALLQSTHQKLETLLADIDRTKEVTRPKGFLIDLLMPPNRAEEALVNILGRYDYWFEHHGPLKARWIFLAQSLGAVLSFWTDWLLKRANLLRFLRPS